MKNIYLVTLLLGLVCCTTSYAQLESHDSLMQKDRPVLNPESKSNDSTISITGGGSYVATIGSFGGSVALLWGIGEFNPSGYSWQLLLGVGGQQILSGTQDEYGRYLTNPNTLNYGLRFRIDPPHSSRPSFDPYGRASISHIDWATQLKGSQQNLSNDTASVAIVELAFGLPFFSVGPIQVSGKDLYVTTKIGYSSRIIITDDRSIMEPLLGTSQSVFNGIEIEGAAVYNSKRFYIRPSRILNSIKIDGFAPWGLSFGFEALM